MRRLLTFTLAIISFAFAALPAQASSNSETVNLLTNSSKPQISIQFGRHRRDDRYRRTGYGYGSSRIETRIVQRGWHTYRETYRIMYYPNGETRTELISRERIDY